MHDACSQRAFYYHPSLNFRKSKPGKDLRCGNKSEITGCVPEISNQHVEQLAKIAAVLGGIANSIDAGKTVVSPEIAAAVEEYVEAGICLRCSKKKTGRYTRGQCINCYNGTREEITNGESLESDWISRGRLTPVAKSGGRKPHEDRPALESLAPRKCLIGKPQQKSSTAVTCTRRSTYSSGIP